MVSKKPHLKIAQDIVGRDIVYSAICKPKPEHVFFKWRGQVYKGSMQHFFEEKPEIAVISNSTHPYEAELVETIRSIDTENERPDVDIPDYIDLEKRKFTVLCIKGNSADSLTPEQKGYFQKHKPNIVDIDISL